MANMAAVNRAVKTRFPNFDIQVIRGCGYVYFDGSDGFDKIQSIMTHPVCTSTEDVTRMAIEQIEHATK
jgi:hypothetical protein